MVRFIETEFRAVKFRNGKTTTLYCLGLDIGTSAVKALVVDELGSVQAEASCALPISHPKSGWCEQDPNDWTAAVKTCCAELKRALDSKWESVGSIGLSGQMHGAVLLDQSKTPIRPAILWNDGRSVAECDAINRKVEDIEDRAGIFAMPGFTAPKLLWCAENEPATHVAIAHIMLPKDYVRLYLTGELATDMADAAGTLWLDQSSRDWDDELCEVSQTRREWLPNLVEGTQVSGTLSSKIAADLGLAAGIPVAGGGGDAAAGALGIGAVNEGDAFASLGTSGQLFVSTENYRPAPGTAVHCYAHCVPSRWFQMACMLNGASPMSWFAAFSNRQIADLLAEAQSVESRLMFLPYLTGERTPHNDANIRGAFYGLGPDTTDAHAMRAVVDAIAYSFCDANDCLKQAGTQLESIAAIGGGTKSDFVLQTLADAMGLSIHRYAGAQTGPALGAARLAMVASGAYSLAEVARKPELDKVFEPDLSKASFHKDRFLRWRELYQTLKPFASS